MRTFGLTLSFLFFAMTAADWVSPALESLASVSCPCPSDGGGPLLLAPSGRNYICFFLAEHATRQKLSNLFPSHGLTGEKLC